MSHTQFQSLRDEYVRTLTTKLAATENTAMAVVLMERIEHYLGPAESVKVEKDSQAPSTNGRTETPGNGRKLRGGSGKAKWPRVRDVLIEHGGLTLSDLAVEIMGLAPPYFSDIPTLKVAKQRLSAVLGGPSKVHFQRSTLPGGKWRAAE